MGKIKEMREDLIDATLYRHVRATRDGEDAEKETEEALRKLGLSDEEIEHLMCALRRVMEALGY